MLAIEGDAPFVIRESIHIEASPETVFATLTDFRSWPSWQKNVSRVDPGAAAVADGVFRWRAGGVTISSKIEWFDPPQGIGWTGRSIGTRAIHVWRVSPDDQGGTRVETDESMRGALFVLPVLRRLMRRSLRQTVEATLVELRSEAEKRAASVEG